MATALGTSPEVESRDCTRVKCFGSAERARMVRALAAGSAERARMVGVLAALLTDHGVLPISHTVAHNYLTQL